MIEKPVPRLRPYERLFFKSALNRLSTFVRLVNERWHVNPKTGRRIKHNEGEQLMLIVTELSEAFEGVRKNLMDEKLPHRKAVEVELADALMRIFHFCGEHKLDVGGAFIEKCDYNATRKDHTFKARSSTHGKKF